MTHGDILTLSGVGFVDHQSVPLFDDYTILVGFVGLLADTLNLHNVFRLFKRSDLFPVLKKDMGVRPTQLTDMISSLGIGPQQLTELSLGVGPQ